MVKKYTLNKEEIEILLEANKHLGESTDSIMNDLVYRTPAQSLRHAADMMEAKDKAISAYRSLMFKIINSG